MSRPSELMIPFERTAFSLSAEEEGLLAPFANVFSQDFATSSLCDRPLPAHNERYRIRITRNQGGYEVSFSDRIICVPTYERASGTIMQTMSDSFVSNASDMNIVMHAATCAFRDGAVVFAGSSGSGKTSLALAFARYYGFLGDECAYVSVMDGTVRHEAFPFQLKRANETILQQFEDVPKLEVDGLPPAYYLPLSAVRRAPGDRLPIRLIAFPVFDRGCQSTEIRPLEGRELPRLLLGSSIGASEPAVVLPLLLRMIAAYNIRLIAIRYGDALHGASDLNGYLVRTEKIAC